MSVRIPRLRPFNNFDTTIGVTHVRRLILAALIAAFPSLLTAQVEGTPSKLVEIETERSRTCVSTLRQIAVLDRVLAPVVIRSTRLREIAEAVALEDRSTVEPFSSSDETETLVQNWFTTDAALAQRYVISEDSGVLAERQAGRETIKAVIAETLTTMQQHADSVLSANTALIQDAGPCDGAIFVRGAVLDACENASGPICDQAALPAGEATNFRFVDTGDSVWEIQETRPWTVPAPLQPTADGQLGGGRTIGYARVGNVAVSLSFSPFFRERDQASVSELAQYDAVNDSLGIAIDHPTIAVAPAFGLRAALNEPLGTETRYVLHFGDINAADILWSGPAGSGTPLEATIPLGAAHVVRFRAGDPVMLTAVGGANGNEPEYSIMIGSVNQTPAATVLLNYMAAQMADDLSRYAQPRG